jgi:beta-N-acetylhexosaminidase
MKNIITSLLILFYKANFLILTVNGFSQTLEEKIGQLFIVPACPLRGEDHLEDLEKLIREQKIGGIILKQGTAAAQVNLIDKLQRLSQIPLLCVQDGEWGVSMRLTDVIAFPKNLTLGAVQDLSLLYQLGQEIGRQCLLVGAHLNLAPVCDVNCNPQNPIIHMRSFGEDPFQVTVRSRLVMLGIQSMGVMACAKHFPGHGDTSVDSHVDLPMIAHSRQRLDAVELFPFRDLIQAGVKAVMSAHLFVEALSEEAFLPATFSKRIVTELLQKEYGFSGLVVTDALNMKALSNLYSPEQTALKAFLAGHDLLLYGDHIAPNVDQILREDVPRAIAALKNAVESGKIPESLIDERVEKILKCKEGLQARTRNETINSPEAYALKKKLYQEAMTLVRNEGLVPLKGKKLALIEWDSSPYFTELIGGDRFSLNDPELFEKVNNYECLVLALAKLPEDDTILDKLSELGIPVAIVVFGSPYRLSNIPLFDTILVAYENEREAQEAAADVLMGRLVSKGRLPVSVMPYFPAGNSASY